MNGGPAHVLLRRISRFEVANAEIMQHVLVVKYFGFNRCDIGKRDCRNRLIFKTERNFRFDRFVYEGHYLCLNGIKTGKV